MSATNGGGTRPRLADQIEIIRDSVSHSRIRGEVLEECLRDLSECTEHLAKHLPPENENDRRHGMSSELERKLERFQRQSKLLQRVLAKIH